MQEVDPTKEIGKENTKKMVAKMEVKLKQKDMNYQEQVELQIEAVEVLKVDLKEMDRKY